MNKVSPGNIIRKYCLPNEPLEEATRIITEKHTQDFTFDDAVDIILSAAEEVSKMGEETKNWTQIDKIAWSVRKAYIAGISYATCVMLQYIEDSANNADNESNK